MSSASENLSPRSAEEYAQHLRQRAEQAAAASMQYASLSERYLDLSNQFAALAEKAATSSVADLQSAVSSIESSLQESRDTADRPGPAASGAGQGTAGDLSTGIPEVTERGTEPSAALQPTVPEPPASGNMQAISADAIQSATEPDRSDGAASEAVPKVAAEGKRSRRKRRLQTRKFVQRVRSVSLAITRRVKVRANKEDLKPQQRKPLEELNRSRGSIATSVAVVVVALFLLSLITLQFDVDVPIPPIMASFADEIAEVEEPQPVEIPEEEQGEQQEEETEEPVEEPIEEPIPEEIADEPVDEPLPDPQPMEEDPADAPEAEVETGEIVAASEGDADQAAVDNRSNAGRQKLLEKFGGSAASESAVQRGLEWIASVQTPQGWWDFTMVGDAGNPGRVNNPIGGTAYALMPFLAAGQTHQQGSYRQQVKAGLDYLCKVGVQVPAGYDLRGVLNKGDEDDEPNEAYYVHGAATLVLCEAWGMTGDRRLRRPAEGALKFLLNSQDPRGGGWRYLPQQAGSTSVTAIQIMALMAAQKAKLKVPEISLQGVMHYLDSVQIDGEGRYGYETEKKTYKGSITAMALLCRMYLGWGRNDGDMRDGVALLDKAGPYENLYSTYFATQVMRNWGGEEWTRWNERMQQDLLATQVTEGPGKGSWKPRTGMHTKQGGRLLETSLATLTLEVYYRYKPILPDPMVGEQQVAAD